MKKTFIALLLALVFSLSASVSVRAGDTPMMGVDGCAPGIYYVPSGICCQPNVECPVGRQIYHEPIKQEDPFKGQPYQKPEQQGILDVINSFRYDLWVKLNAFYA